MDIDQSEERISSTSQSDSKLYEGSNNKNSDAKHSFSETATNRATETKEENVSKDDENILNKKCIEKLSENSQMKNQAKKDPARAESMIRETITKMEKHRDNPGMASARSLTNLISADYGWMPTAVYSKVEKALKSAAQNGIIKEMTNKKNGQISYTVSTAKVKKYVKRFNTPPGNNKSYLYKHFSDLMNDE